MPPPPRPPIPPGYAKLELSGTVMSHVWKNVLYLAIAGSGIATSDLNTLAGTINTSWGTRFISSLSDLTSLTNVKIVYIPSVGNEIVGVSSVTKTGSRAGGNLASAAGCYVVNWNVNKYYRGGHPRMYLPGVETADLTNGSTVAGATRTGLVTAANGFLNDVNAATTANITSVQLGTLSFQHSGAWRNPPVFWPFVSSSVANFLGTQRRRIHS